MGSRAAYNVRLNVPAFAKIKQLSDEFYQSASRIVDLFLADAVAHPPTFPPNCVVPGPYGNRCFSLDVDLWQRYNDSIISYYNPRLVLSYVVCDEEAVSRVRQQIAPPSTDFTLSLSRRDLDTLQDFARKNGKTVDEVLKAMIGMLEALGHRP